MLGDLVVDTNVFVHANNKGDARYQESKNLATRLLHPDVTTSLRVDPGFHVDEARNRSRITSEYFEKLVPGMLGHTVVQVLAASMRVLHVALPADQNTRRSVRDLVSDPVDRMFLLVAISSDERTLVSHDDAAFSQAVTDDAAACWGVDIVEAIGATPRL